MKWLWLLCIPLSLSAETIRVLTTKLEPKLYLEIQGGHRAETLEERSPMFNNTKGRKGTFLAVEKGLKWHEVFSGIHEMRIIPDKPYQLGLYTYEGTLEIYDVAGALTTVNEVDIETYLKSQLDQAISPTLSPATLEAIAIVARTQLYYLAQKETAATWHVKQGKTGYPRLPRHAAITQAIENTRGQILTYHGKPFPSTWVLNSGGQTSAYTSVFRRRHAESPPGTSHLPAGVRREMGKWSVSIPPEKLAQLAELDQITGVELFHIEKTPKVYGIRLIDGDDHKDIDFPTFQKWLGPDLLKSNDFTLSFSSGRILFTGYGEGVGVGLCLVSAEAMARHGHSAKKILARHYPLTQLIK